MSANALPLPRGAFWPRLMLAALLALGSEVLVWTNPVSRPLADWLPLAVGYFALGTLLLDLIARYRVRDLFGAVLLAGVYGLCASLILNPETMLNDLPRTLLTRVMGAHALLALEMIGLFLALTVGGSARRPLLLGCVVVGVAWGIWVRWFPADTGYPDVALPAMLVYGVAAWLVASALAWLTARQGTGLSVDALRLPPLRWGLAVIVLLGMLAVRVVQGLIPPAAWWMVLGPLALCLVILWFRGRARGRTLLDDHLPPVPPPPGLLGLAAAVFLGAAVLAYSLPRIQVGEFDQLLLIGIGFTAYGLAWLPAISLVLGVRAYLRQFQAGRL